MTDVAIIGVGQTRYGMFPERSLKDLFHEAASEAFADVDKGLDPADVDEARKMSHVMASRGIFAGQSSGGYVMGAYETALWTTPER